MFKVYKTKTKAITFGLLGQTKCKKWHEHIFYKFEWTYEVECFNRIFSVDFTTVKCFVHENMSFRLINLLDWQMH